jgi:peptidoglycan/LPS O-acetylase OafA/YrhL
MRVAHRWGGRRWIGIVALVFTFSLALSMWTKRSDPYAAFHLAPYRVWELLLGALLASAAVPSIRSQWLRDGAAALGLAFIAYAVFRYSATTAFPGAAALVPCLGAGALRHALRGSSPRDRY